VTLGRQIRIKTRCDVNDISFFANLETKDVTIANKNK